MVILAYLRRVVAGFVHGINSCRVTSRYHHLWNDLAETKGCWSWIEKAWYDRDPPCNVAQCHNGYDSDVCVSNTTIMPLSTYMFMYNL